jgi:HNH endonuclease
MPFQYYCEQCGSSFLTPQRTHSGRIPRFCSRSCCDAARRHSRPPIPQNDGTALVTLTQGKVAIIDGEDIPLVTGRRWSLFDGRYASSGSGSNTESPFILMHHLIIDCGEFVTDHINGTGWDNRRRNLRCVTRGENVANAKLRPNSSGYRGVAWSTSYRKWRAKIRQLVLGYYDTPEDAARVYDAAAREEWGLYAHVNFPTVK